MLRRLKADVLKSLPVKTVVENKVAMTEQQLIRYNTLKDEIKETTTTNKETSEHNHMMWVMMLRKLTNHPLLLRYFFEVKCSIVLFVYLLLFIFIYNFRTKNYTKWPNYYQ